MALAARFLPALTRRQLGLSSRGAAGIPAILGRMVSSSPAVQIRDYLPTDKPFVLDLINEGFEVDTRFTDPGSLNIFLEIFLHTALIRSTHFRVALIDDKPVGLLIGRIKGDPALPGTGRKLAAIGSGLARLLPVFPRQLPGLKDWVTEQLAGAKLVRTATARNLCFDNELVLFVVGSETRGTGVGKALFREFTDSAREFFLYTDSRCTWQFYEKRGMRRVAETRRITPLVDEPVDHFLYAY